MAPDRNTTLLEDLVQTFTSDPNIVGSSQRGFLRFERLEDDSVLVAWLSCLTAESFLTAFDVFLSPASVLIGRSDPQADGPSSLYEVYSEHGSSQEVANVEVLRLSTSDAVIVWEKVGVGDWADLAVVAGTATAAMSYLERVLSTSEVKEVSHLLFRGIE